MFRSIWDFLIEEEKKQGYKLTTSSSLASGLCSATITIRSSFSTFVENTAILEQKSYNIIRFYHFNNVKYSI